MAKYTSTGALDMSFGMAGKAMVALDVARTPEVVRNPDGSYFVVGPSAAANASTRISKITAAGQPDTTFGTGGRADGPSPLGGANIVDAKVDGSGRLLVAYSQFTVGRFTAAGALDTSWGNGFATATLQAGERATTLGFQSDGKIILMGGKDRGLGGVAMAPMIAVRFVPCRLRRCRFFALRSHRHAEAATPRRTPATMVGWRCP